MKHLPKVGTALLIMGMTVFASCENGMEPTERREPSFFSYDDDAALRVDNRTSSRLIAFKGTVTEDTLLGGIPANRNNHALWRNPSLFQSSGSFSVVLVTEADFNANRDSLGILDTQPFARMFAFYNHGTDNPVRHTISISSLLGGMHTVEAINNTNLHAELRIDSRYGQSIGVAAHGGRTLLPFGGIGNTFVFPVFQVFHPVQNTIVDFFPVFPHNRAPFFFSRGFGATAETWILNVQDAWNAIDGTVTLGAAWVTIQNQSTISSVEVLEGTEPQRDMMGTSLFSPGTRRTFSFSMATDVGNAVLSERTFHNLHVGAGMGTEVPVRAGTADGPTSFTLLTDMHYTITVTGSHIDGSLQAVIDLENALQITLDDF